MFKIKHPQSIFIFENNKVNTTHFLENRWSKDRLLIAENQTKKTNFYTQKSIKLHCLKKYSLIIFQEESRALGVLIREIFASPRVGTVQKGATNYQIYTKRVKFEGRIKGFSAEWENFEEGYFLKHFRGGGGQNLPKVLHSKCII